MVARCNFALVLLEGRREYKCAQCSKVFPQLFVDNKEFRRENKLRRVLEQNRFDAGKKRY